MTDAGNRPVSAERALQRRIAELTVLYEVSRALQQTLDEEEALYTILVGVTAGGGLAFNRAFLMLVDPEGRQLRGRLAIGPSSPEEASEIWRRLYEQYRSLGELLDSIHRPGGIQKDSRVNEIASRLVFDLSGTDSALVRIMHAHEPTLVSGGKVALDGMHIDASVPEILGTADFAVAPLYFGDRDLGLLLADNYITRAPVEVSNLRLLQIYAQQASAAIQNTRLYRELMEKISVCEYRNTQLREQQYHLLQAERLSTIGKMAALLAHEIRTPLVSIGGFARRMLRSTEDPDPRKEDAGIIVSEVMRLERLVNEVLGLSKVARPDFAFRNLNAIVAQVLRTLQQPIEERGVAVSLRLDPGLPDAWLDESQLHQALINLVSNALDAMPSGGTLSIDTALDGDYIDLTVADTGTGIAEEEWSKLFTPFFTTKTTGTGLGLAIVSQVMKNHEGSVGFESTPGCGTRFRMRLAVHPPVTPNHPPPLEMPEPNRRDP